MVAEFVAGTRVHIIGVGGAGMSAIARVLAERGCLVTGSDAAQSERLPALAAAGVSVRVGHDARAIQTQRPDVVIVSTAVPDDDVEVQAALAENVTVIRRPGATALLTQAWRNLAISGTHGKTTTSSMLTLILRHAGIDCSYLLGSELHATGVNAHEGSSPWAVVEADESDGTALRLLTEAVAVTNVDADHLDRWGSIERMKEAFQQFVSGSHSCHPKLAVLCADDSGAASLAVPEGVERVSYGFVSTADVQVEIVREHSDGCEFSVHGQLEFRARTRVPGRHNVLNAVAASVLASHAGVNPEVIAAGLEDYQGARRRFELRGSVGDVRVFDDYAHHPTAVAATLSAARSVTKGRVVVLCQPYRWYRTAMFVREYAEVLGAADWAVLVDVYGPGEQPVAGAGAADIVLAARAHGAHVDYAPTKADAVALLASGVGASDIILTLGGEDIRPVGLDLLQALRGSA